MSPTPGSLLQKVNSPADLRLLDIDELPRLCDELRQFIIEVISANPGHLGASLGAVELAVAIHYAFDTPNDKLIWDVGHQAYAHKIITGRRDQFYTNRTRHGLSGFPKMSESEYDAFGVGHASTSVSAALGMAIAANLQHDNTEQHVAVIGDGAMTGGMAMEALNNAGVSGTNLLLILNDNGIAIDKNVGALREYLLDIVTSRTYNKIKDYIWKLMGGNTSYGQNSRAIVKQIGNALKTTIWKRSNLFESFNFRYFGPVDGHDVIRLTRLMADLKKIPGPKLLHAVTVKGKGFKKAELDQILYHSPGVFDKNTGEIIEEPCKSLPPKYQHVFGKTIIELARMNDKIVGVTPAMPTGCSLNMMMEVMPERAFDVGIAEQHAVTFSAGMAARGMIPYCNIYSSFMQRAYDQVIHDVALQGLQVVFCLDRSGLVGEDGPTHHGAFDLAYFRPIPGLIISAPMNEVELRNLMFTAQLENKGPFVIRYPRGRATSTDWKQPFEEIKIGSGRVLKNGDKIVLLSIGHPGNFAAEACNIMQEEGINSGHIDMRFLKPLDETLLHEAFNKYQHIITIEDGVINGGLGSAVIEFMADHHYQAQVTRLGIPDKYIDQESIGELRAECGFDTAGIVNTIRRTL
ncbi:MAG: 1-deoxy-D-xylulose-5-phosphate synthase, partial [Lentimicrobiaceae bacterium]|nr:1-deoxy-D-xylulose-5-phosphate synthase [Lentimicrobiaceae bacterium]